MRLLNRFLAAICLITAVLGASTVQAADLAVEDKAKQIWQLLDYLAVDYSAAVVDGKVTDQAEYAEMREFAQVAERHLSELPGSAGKAGLLAQAAALKAAIEGKAAPAEVGARAQPKRDAGGVLPSADGAQESARPAERAGAVPGAVRRLPWRAGQGRRAAGGAVEPAAGGFFRPRARVSAACSRCTRPLRAAWKARRCRRSAL